MFCVPSTPRSRGDYSCVCRAGRVWPCWVDLLAWHFDNTGNKIQDVKVPLDLTVSLLRMLIFVATAAFAQLLGIGWKNKVLQLATALSFFSAVGLIVSLVERYSGGSRSWSLFSVAFILNSVFWSGYLQLKRYAGANSVHKWNSFWLHLLGGRSTHVRRWYGCR